MIFVTAVKSDEGQDLSERLEGLDLGKFQNFYDHCIIYKYQPFSKVYKEYNVFSF